MNKDTRYIDNELISIVNKLIEAGDYDKAYVHLKKNSGSDNSLVKGFGMYFKDKPNTSSGRADSKHRGCCVRKVDCAECSCDCCTECCCESCTDGDDADCCDCCDCCDN